MSSPSARAVLVVEDRPTDRLYLTTLLGYRGFTVLEAGNGEEGLAVAVARRPDLVISDVLMPRMDGYEFVRRLRRLPECANIPVLFYTATYHESEARQLAEECGVFEVLIKPSEPDVILSRVDAVLSKERTDLGVLSDEAFGERYVRLTADTLMDKVRALESSERRMAALIDVGQQFMAERDPVALLNRVCDALCSATECTGATVAILTPDHGRFAKAVARSARPGAAERLTALRELPAALQQVVAQRRPLRGRMPPGRAYAHLAIDVDAFMVVPMIAADQVLGLMVAGNKIGGALFDDADQQVALTLGVQAGIAYENIELIEQLQTHAAQLREREEITEFALSAAGIGIYERSLVDGSIRASAGVRTLLGVDKGNTLEDFSSALDEDERQRLLAVINPAIEVCGDFRLDMTINRRVSSLRHIHARGRIQPDEHGRPQRLLSVLIDMTERRTLEEQLRQAQKMEAIGQLAGGVAHDFNNLLTVIQGYSRFLVDSSRDAEQQRDAEAIIAASERAVGLTRQLLAFSRRQPRDVASFDLNLLLEGVSGMLGRLIGEHIELQTSLGPDTGSIENDRGQIEQVVMNLVVNARDAMPAGGTVTIETSRVISDGTTWVRLAVRDTGTGMSDEVKAHIFEPFFTTKPTGKGTGLGLATVFGIVAQSEGKIDVDSVLGQGTTFTILLPAATGVTAAPVAVARGPIRGTESVLIVEDDQPIRTLAATILRRAGYTVSLAGGAQEALSTPLETIDLILTDVLMPGGIGPQLIAAARERRPDIRVLYMSGYAPDDALDVAAFDDRTSFLAKPFTGDSLTRKIREVLDR